MKNDINEIKNILEEEQTRVRTEKELEQELIKAIIFALESDDIIKTYDNLKTIEYRNLICDYVANSQREFDYLFINYDKVYKKIKDIYNYDIEQKRAEQTEQTKIKRESPTIFGVNWLLFLIMMPICIIWGFIEQNNKHH